MADLPTGTVTFLFTDIEGSITRWEQHPEAMQAALARHNAILREAIEGHGGVVFKTVGDAFYAVFVTAPDAIQAALTAQRALQAEPWPETLGPVRVRMALHTGTAEQRDADYFGPTLNRIARLLDAGYGSQTLLSVATQDLVYDQLPSDVHLHDLGDHRLRDLIRAEHIFQLVAPDLPATFPPLRTPQQRQTLPAQLTPLLGREQELAAVGALLRRPHLRLVTLTGPGGTGKTRLALQAAANLLDHFPDGVCFVELAPITDPALVVSTIAHALGLKETGGHSLLESLQAYLHAQRQLLVLDNFEQVLPAAPLVTDLLQAASHLKVLVTSRAVLHLSGEHEFPVPPLALPDPRRLPPIEHLTQYAAVALFLQRARAVKPDFEVTGETAPAVAAICARLDGLPLAIELAATRIKILAPQALLAQLTNPLPTLMGSARDVPGRQQTLRGAIDWSYNLLERDAQTLFARLGVFVGGCLMEAVEAVCNPRGDLALDLFDALTSLVDQSLLRPVEHAAPTGESGPRFGMLETIRAYALERLELRGEAQAMRQQHLHFFLALAEAAELGCHGSEQQVWLRRLEVEYDNLRAALAWALRGTPQPAGTRLSTAGDVEAGARLAAALWLFWVAQGQLREGRTWLEEALTHSSGVSAAVRVQVLYRCGYLAWRQGDYRRVAELNAESMPLCQQVGDTCGSAWTRRLLGEVALIQGEYTQATMHFEESLALFRQLSDTWGEAGVLISLGYVAQAQGDDERAAAWFRESLARFRDHGDRQGSAWALLHLGGVLVAQGDYQQARALQEEGLALFWQLGDRHGSAWALNDVGWTAYHAGDYGAARARLDESLTALRELGDQQGMAAVLHNQGHLAQARGDYGQAVTYFRESLARFWRQEHLASVADCLAGLAGLAVVVGEPRRAAWLFGVIDALPARVSPSNRAAYALNLAAARTQLDAATWEAAWAEGRAMTLEQAIAYALEESADA
ncbi:MAG: tetratricopeptide repeat protein [Chloroflexota bacterium]|nr:tetratricopeptide repeat protein [Chloroflexota bacterium]